MKAVFIGESSGASMDEIMALYPRHKKVAEAFIDKVDPFVLEGLVRSYVIRDWNDSLLPD